jgi:hypothetical protein
VNRRGRPPAVQTKIPTRTGWDSKKSERFRLGLLGFFYIDGVQAFLAVDYLKRYFVVLSDLGPPQTRYVYENVLTRFVVNDKAEPLALVEKFYCTGLHKKKALLKKPMVNVAIKPFLG